MRRIQRGALLLGSTMDVDALFEALLRAPLADYAKLPAAQQPIVMMFDALDEADSMSSSSSSTNVPMMRLLCELCSTLPGVYFVMTSRCGKKRWQ